MIMSIEPATTDEVMLFVCANVCVITEINAHVNFFLDGRFLKTSCFENKRITNDATIPVNIKRQRRADPRDKEDGSRDVTNA
jgi:hypothetical protein